MSQTVDWESARPAPPEETTVSPRVVRDVAAAFLIAAALTMITVGAFLIGAAAGLIACGVDALLLGAALGTSR